MTSNSSSQAVFAKCLYTDAAHSGKKVLGEWGPGERPYDLTLGGEYPIFGIGIFEGAFSALVLSDARKPDWVPVKLLGIGSLSLPADWELAVFDSELREGADGWGRWAMRCGYTELAHNLAHVEGLIERDEEQLRVFYREVAARCGSDS
jgi:hypothetical protein